MVFPANGGVDHVLIHGRIAYGWDGTNAYPLKITSDGTLLISTPFESRVDVDIAQVEGAYAAGDVVSVDDCCTTIATYWTFPNVARETGGFLYLTGATLFNETENQAVQYDLRLFNAAPTGQQVGGVANDNPLKADIAKWIGIITFPATTADGATVATITEVGPSTVGRVSKLFKCAAGATSIFGVLVTNTVYTQTNGDTISITLLGEQF